MLRKLILVAAIATIFSSSIVAQELSRLDINSSQFDAPNQVRVNSLPTDFFADGSNETAELTEAQGNTQLQNLLVIAGFATLLSTGGIITGFYLVKRRSRTAPPVKLCV